MALGLPICGYGKTTTNEPPHHGLKPEDQTRTVPRPILTGRANVQKQAETSAFVAGTTAEAATAKARKAVTPSLSDLHPSNLTSCQPTWGYASPSKFKGQTCHQPKYLG
jgi:hypothetical protein